ncbi:hypothetical protein DV737_g3662, partial [Chaetothyriales sp. CBS 132003]
MAAPTATAAADAAPVVEFRCLFSRDGHKKRKTFHDGTLKFHAFNARVMVYDLDRHYVGDLHYRHDDDFDEGLELRLDSGVVVQVQDRLGQTLTPLDQKLKPAVTTIAQDTAATLPFQDVQAPKADAASSTGASALLQSPPVPAGAEAASQIDVQGPVGAVETVTTSSARGTAIFARLSEPTASARHASRPFNEGSPS